MRPFHLSKVKTNAQPSVFTTATWEKYSLTTTANSTVSPDGRTNATRFAEGAVNDYHYARLSTGAQVSSTPYVFEAYVKSYGGRQWFCMDNGNSAFAVYFDIINGVVGNTGGSVTATRIDALGNGWFYCAVGFNGNGSNSNLTLLSASANGTISFTGSATSGFYIWKAGYKIGYLHSNTYSASSRTGIILDEPFETTTFMNNYGLDANAGAITRSNAITAKEGNYSGRFELHDTDPFVAGSVRAELNLSGPAPDGNGGGEFTQRTHWWVGLATYLDPTTYNTSDSQPESIWQMHNQPNTSVGQNWGSYKFQNPYRMQIRNGNYEFVLQYDTTKSRSSTSSNGSATISLGAITTGVWVKWVLHIYPDYNSGILELWKDGVLVVNGNPNQAGNTWYNDDHGPYMKMGIYKWPWDSQAGRDASSVSTRVLFIDSLRWGNATSDYSSVLPG